MSASTFSDELEIRRAVVGDAPMLAEFAARTFDETFAEFNDPEDFALHLQNSFGTQKQAAEIANPDNVTLLAFAGEQLLAFAQVRNGAYPACVTVADPVELHRFYVDRPAHGTGLAATLMQAVIDAVRELGGQHVWLGVWEQNARAIAFYKKANYVDVGSQTFMLGTDEQTDRVFVTAVERD